MAEYLASILDKREGPKERTELKPEAVYRMDTPDGLATIAICSAPDGTKSVLRFLNVLPEVLFGEHGPTSKPDTLFQGLRDSKLGKLMQMVGGLTAVAAGAAACSTDLGHNAGQDNHSSFGVQSAALTGIDQVMNVGTAQQVPGSILGDGTSNFAELGGKQYYLVDRADHVAAVDCDELLKCMDLTKAKPVGGLNNSPALYGNYYDAAMYTDNNGGGKFLVNTDYGSDTLNTGSGGYRADVSADPTGQLQVSKIQYITPEMGSGSFFMKDGDPKILWAGGLRDLNTDTDTDVGQDYNDLQSCGPATFDGNVAIGSHHEVVGGVDWCQLIMAPTLEELKTNPTLIATLNQQQAALGEHLLRNPRLKSDGANGSILVFAVGDSFQETQWYAVIPPKAVPAPDASSGDSSGDAADAGSSPDADANGSTDAVAPAPDAQTTVDAAIDAAKSEVADDVDAVVFIDANDADLVEVDANGNDIPPDAADVPPDVPPDVDQPDTQDAADTQIAPDVQVAPDATPDGESDTLDASKPQPDTTPDTAQPDVTVTPTLTGFDVTVGKDHCQLKDVTSINEGGKNGFKLTVDGTGTEANKCRLEGISKGLPVNVDIWNDVDGNISITCTTFGDKGGESALSCIGGLNSIADIQEQGAGALLVIDGVTLGSSASHFYGAKRPDVKDPDGSIHQVFEVRNAQGEPVVTLQSPNFLPLEIAGDGQKYIVDSKTGDHQLKQQFPDTDAGTSIDISVQHPDAGGGDTVAQTPENPGKGGGCTAVPGSEKGSPSQIALLLAAFSAFFARRRRA